MPEAYMLIQTFVAAVLVTLAIIFLPPFQGFILSILIALLHAWVVCEYFYLNKGSET